MTSIGWGELADSESYGRMGDNLRDYKVIYATDPKCPDVLAEKSHYQQASHGMIYARQPGKLWNLYEQRGLVMMQMRFDGLLGFPGGLMDEGETPLKCVNREMHEEIGFDVSKDPFKEEHHLSSYVHEEKRLVLHFYVKEVTPDEFRQLEINTLNALEYGIETLGVIRVPLFTMGDGERGFPAFLANQFAGNAKSELVAGLIFSKLFTQEELTESLNASHKLLSQTQS